jgi:hypothetical protein
MKTAWTRQTCREKKNGQADIVLHPILGWNRFMKRQMLYGITAESFAVHYEDEIDLWSKNLRLSTLLWRWLVFCCLGSPYRPLLHEIRDPRALTVTWVVSSYWNYFKCVLFILLHWILKLIVNNIGIHVHVTTDIIHNWQNRSIKLLCRLEKKLIAANGNFR